MSDINKRDYKKIDLAEFDRFADSYREQHAENIKASGESPDFFARYKVEDLKKILCRYDIEPLRVLDFGSGVGNSIPFFREIFPGAQLVCADVSERSIDLSKSRFPGSEEYVHIDGDYIPLIEGACDVVFTACVFHHIPHSQHLHWLKELRRVLRPGGILVVFEHNPYNPLTVRAVNSCPIDENAELIRPVKMKRSLVDSGFHGLDLRYRIFFPAFFRLLRPLEKYMEHLGLGAQYYAVGEKPLN